MTPATTSPGCYTALFAMLLVVALVQLTLIRRRRTGRLTEPVSEPGTPPLSGPAR